MNICVIQARLHSQRLPCKAMAPILGEPLIQHVVRRAQWMVMVERVVLAVPPADVASFAKVALSQRVAIYSPDVPEQDVLARYAAVARELGLADTDRIVRVTGDCPGLDPRVSDAVVRLAQDVDFAANTRDWPDGLDTEVFTVGLLKKYEAATSEVCPICWKKNCLSEREHVTLGMRSGIGTVAELPLDPSQRWRKWSVDDERDLEYVREIFKAYGPNWGWRQAVQLESEPGLICDLCKQGFGHLNRASKMIWDLHEKPVSGGRVFEECMAYEVLQRKHDYH